ncbi:hypothetical protein VPH35_079541 [Triticum aestivum]
MAARHAQFHWILFHLFASASSNCEYLGAEPALPYLSPYTDVGILNDTGVQFVNIIRIAQQLQNFQDYQQRLAAYVGEDAARERVSQSLVLITLGGNDFVNNYYLVPFSARSQQFEIHDYVHFIISEYKKVLAGDMDDGKEASSAGLNNSGRYWIGLCRNYGKGNLRATESSHLDKVQYMVKILEFD